MTLPDPAMFAKFFRQIEKAATDAGWTLKRAADGDYRPDPAARFPAFYPTKAGASVQDLFDRWRAETKPSASTLSTWNRVFRHFRKRLRDKANDVTTTPEDLIAWKGATVDHAASLDGSLQPSWRCRAEIGRRALLPIL